MSEAWEDFLQVKTYEEYDRRRQEFAERGLRITDHGVREHLREITSYIGDGIKDGIIYELFHEASAKK